MRYVATKYIAMKYYLLFVFPFLLGAVTGKAQIVNNPDTLYGPEWIKFNQTYFKIPVTADGVYRITSATLQNGGVPPASVKGVNFQVFRLGKEIPLYVSTDGTFGAADYIEFFGKRNRFELDGYMFKNGAADALNPDYSVITDTAIYYLTWNTAATNNRFAAAPNDLSNVPAKEPYFLHSLLLAPTAAHNKPSIDEEISYSDFVKGEGWGTDMAQMHTLTLTPAHIFTGADATLNLRLAFNYNIHYTEVKINNQLLKKDTASLQDLHQLSIPIPAALLNGAMTLTVGGTSSALDKHAIGVVDLQYPRTFDFDNQTSFNFRIAASNAPKYIEINNFNAGGTPPVLYDLTNNLRIVTSVSQGTVKILLPPSAQARDLTLVNDASGSVAVKTFAPIAFTDFSKDAGDYVILSDARLIGSGSGPVQDYAAYRASPDGGGYRTKIIDVANLYDAFAYGEPRHPIAVRNFVHYIQKKWANVKYLVLMGKGREYLYARTPGQLALPENAGFDVPTWGYPGSDNLLAASNNSSSPVIACGRIPATGGNDIAIYLAKIKESEYAQKNAPQTIEGRAWMKQVFHLGGGGDLANLIKGYLSDMAQTITNSRIGANVNSFFKSSGDATQIPTALTEQVYAGINNGATLVTFFGHSATGLFDFNVDDFNQYNNRGKYPVLIALGCYSGNIHTGSVGISEHFVLTPAKAYIAYEATTGTAYPDALYDFTNYFYKLAGGAFYGKGIGDIIKFDIASLDSAQRVNNPSLISALQEFTLNGDPAVRLNPSPGPDYITDAASVKFNPETLNTQLDSFSLSFNVQNIGQYINDSLTVSVAQETPAGVQIGLFKTRIKAPAYSASLNFRFPMNRGQIAGVNKFYIRLNEDNKAQEAPQPAAALNNDLLNASGAKGVEVFISDAAARPVYPPEFSIVSKPDLTLSASSVNPLTPVQTYLMEIDTTELFNSPGKVSTKITQKGGVVKWKPNIGLTNNTVYFWRISPDSVNKFGYSWAKSSFTYIANSPNGWNQGNYFQYTKDSLLGIRIDSAGRNFGYSYNYFDYRIKNKVFDLNDEPDVFYFGIPINDAFRNLWATLDADINVLVIDSIITKYLFQNPPGGGPYGSVNTTGQNFLPQIYQTAKPESRKSMINFLENVVPDGAYVLIYSAQATTASDYRPQDWAKDSLTNGGKNIFNVLEKQGAMKIRTLASRGSVPYALMYQKNRKAFVEEDVAADVNSVIYVNHALAAVYYEGKLTTQPIGPSKKWSALKWEVKDSASFKTDVLEVSVFGITASGKHDSLFSTTARNVSLQNVSAAVYPYLQLSFHTKNTTQRLTPSLSYWRVEYDGVPEIALNPNLQYSFYKDTLQQGDKMKMQIAMENISIYKTDSVLIKYSVSDENNAAVLTGTRKLKALSPGDSTLVDLTIDTRSLQKINRLFLDVNPNNDQPELTHFNNTSQNSFFVQKDLKNPLLDVTFDGLHILNGDIVSAKPFISIALRDDNKYLALADTSLLNISLGLPDGSVQPLSFSNSAVRFIPADPNNLNKENKARVEFNPALVKDGTYKLIVKGKDASGNAAGAVDYKVSFQVINKSMLSNVLNYPNPFSSSTQFVYTLTGSEAPTFFKIQIMTVSGKIVREITQNELGSLKIGTHRTDFSWNGTDEYGDKLANGVYLYRIVAKNANKESFDKYDTQTDAFFKQGMGKLVIVR